MMINMDDFTEEAPRASRNFSIGDEVQAFFEGKWYYGIVTKKERRGNEPPNLTIKTYKRVSNELDSILGGYGLTGHADSRILFSHETPYLGNRIYNEVVKRKLTPQEIKQIKKEMAEMPF